MGWGIRDQDFVECLEDGRLDDAWGLLSGAAEVALALLTPSAMPCADRRRSLVSEGLTSSSSRSPTITTSCGSFARLRELVPQLRYFAGDLSEAGAVVEQLVQEFQSQEAWEGTDKSFVQSCAWVKRKADQAQRRRRS